MYSNLPTGLKVNCILGDFLCPYQHWFLIDFNVVLNYTQKLEPDTLTHLVTYCVNIRGFLKNRIRSINFENGSPSQINYIMFNIMSISQAICLEGDKYFTQNNIRSNNSGKGFSHTNRIVFLQSIFIDSRLRIIIMCL